MNEMMTAGVSPDAWFATVLVADLAHATSQNKPLGFKLCGQDLAIWRTRDGSLVVQEDRCAHVDAELSTGICNGEYLLCAYHGWTHDPDGSARPPGARNWKTPAKGWRKIKTFPAFESRGVVWTSLASEGDVTTATPLELPDVDVRSVKLDLPAPDAFGQFKLLVDSTVRNMPPITGQASTALTFDIVSIAPDLAKETGLIGLAVTPITDTSSQAYVFASTNANVANRSVVDQIIDGLQRLTEQAAS